MMIQESSRNIYLYICIYNKFVYLEYYVLLETRKDLIVVSKGSLYYILQFEYLLQWRHMKVMLSHITGKPTVCPTVCLGYHERKIQNPRY